MNMCGKKQEITLYRQSIATVNATTVKIKVEMEDRTEGKWIKKDLN